MANEYPPGSEVAYFLDPAVPWLAVLNRSEASRGMQIMGGCFAGAGGIALLLAWRTLSRLRAK